MTEPAVHPIDATIGVTGMNATDNPAPGVGVAHEGAGELLDARRRPPQAPTDVQGPARHDGRGEGRVDQAPGRREAYGPTPVRAPAAGGKGRLHCLYSSQ